MIIVKFCYNNFENYAKVEGSGCDLAQALYERTHDEVMHNAAPNYMVIKNLAVISFAMEYGALEEVRLRSPQQS